MGEQLSPVQCGPISNSINIPGNAIQVGGCRIGGVVNVTGSTRQRGGCAYHHQCSAGDRKTQFNLVTRSVSLFLPRQHNISIYILEYRDELNSSTVGQVDPTDTTTE